MDSCRYRTRTTKFRNEGGTSELTNNSLAAFLRLSVAGVVSYAGCNVLVPRVYQLAVQRCAEYYSEGIDVQVSELRTMYQVASQIK